MARKADLEAAHQRRLRIHRESEALEQSGEFRRALHHAETAIPDFADSLAFQRRYETGQPQLPEVDRILRLAPPLFAHQSLTRLQAYCESRKKPERESLPDLAERIHRSRESLSAAIRLWSTLHQHDADPVDVAPGWQGLVDIWQRMGAVTASTVSGSPRFAPTTHLQRNVRVKCSSCGRQGRAAAEKFLEPRTCPACKTRNWFVILFRDF